MPHAHTHTSNMCRLWNSLDRELAVSREDDVKESASVQTLLWRALFVESVCNEQRLTEQRERLRVSDYCAIASDRSPCLTPREVDCYSYVWRSVPSNHNARKDAHRQLSVLSLVREYGQVTSLSADRLNSRSVP